MSKSTVTYYLRPDRGSDETLRWLRHQPGHTAQSGHGSWEQFAGQVESGARLVFLAPACRLLTLSAELPGVGGKRLQQALPYALEEAFAEEVERMHLASGGRERDGRIPVIAVTRAQMQQWQQRFEQVHLQPRRWLHEALLLPWAEGQWSLLLEEDQALLRCGRHEGLCLPAPLPQPLLRRSMEERGAPETLTVFDARSERGALPDGLDALTDTHVQPQPLDEPLALLQQGDDGAAINLLQGPFSQREQLGRFWRPWRLSASLLLAVVLLQGLMAGHRYWSLSTLDEQLYQQIGQVFRETFPEVQNVVNPRVQMERRLASLRGGGREDGFAQLLGLGGPLLAGVEKVQLNSMRYARGELELELQLESLQQLDRLKAGWQERGVSVEVRNASTADKRVVSRIALRRQE